MEKIIQVMSIIALTLGILIVGDIYIEKISVRFKLQQDQIQSINGLAKQQEGIMQFLKQNEEKGK